MLSSNVVPSFQSFSNPKRAFVNDARIVNRTWFTKIPCADCGWCYIGETGRCFETRKEEHIRNVKTCANGSNIAKHAWSFDHRIDFDNSSVIDKGSFRIRKTLEFFLHTNICYLRGGFRPTPACKAALNRLESP